MGQKDATTDIRFGLDPATSAPGAIVTSALVGTSWNSPAKVTDFSEAMD